MLVTFALPTLNHHAKVKNHHHFSNPGSVETLSENKFSQARITLHTDSVLEQTRLQHFVGRAAELWTFQQALRNHWLALMIHGPGGVGKTTLLSKCAELARNAGTIVVHLDCRYLEASPKGFKLGLLAALGASDLVGTLAALPKTVLMLDTYEALAPLDNWVREQFMPQLPPQTLLVVAGRNPPSLDWRSEATWGTLMGALELGNLSPTESRDLLAQRGVQDEVGWALEFTRGHPLTLSLLTDVWRQNPSFDPQASPDLIGALLERFVSEVPSPPHRQALEALSQVRALNEAQLREALGLSEVHDLFSWLRKLSFVQQGSFGLLPHDLVRDVLNTDFRWRDPDSHALMHQRVRRYYFRRIGETRGSEQLRHIFDLVFLHRGNPVLKQFYDWKNFGNLYSETANPTDHETIAEIVERHEGPESAALARHWLQRQPGAFTIVRGEGGRVIGLMALLELTQATSEDAERDPAVAAAWDFMRRHKPPKPGQSAVLARFFMDAGAAYQQSSPVCNHLGLSSSQRWLTDPHLSWMILAFRDLEYYREYMAYYDHHIADLSYQVGRHTYGAYVHDWREVSAAQWLEKVGERELISEPVSVEPASALTQFEFAEAVRAALRDFAQPNALAANPLLASRLVPPSQNPTRALRQTIWEAAQQLRLKPRDEKFYRALEATYLEPAATQELAAERLSLPFGTYRYQLNKALERVTEWLWRRAQ